MAAKTILDHSVLNAFLEQVATAEKRVLLLDYDGTLAPFHAERDRAFPYPSLEELLDTLQTTAATRLVMVTGRPAHDLAGLLRLRPLPEIWGSHGRERLLPSGIYEVTTADSLALRALAEADAWMEAQGWGEYLEPKAGATALHWRGLPSERVREMGHRLHDLADLCRQGGLRLRGFDGGVEIGVAGADKGTAVDTVLAEMGPGTVAAYLGDELTDEDAFRALRGRGLGVLVRARPRPTAADIWLVPPEGVVHFLNEWLLAAGGEL